VADRRGQCSPNVKRNRARQDGFLVIRPVAMVAMLEGVLRRNLEKAGIRRVVLEEVRSVDLATVRTVRTVSIIVGVVERGVVEKVERIHAKLQALFAKCGEALEERHVDAVVAGAVGGIRSAAEQGNRRCRLRYGSTKLISRRPCGGADGCDRIPGNWIGKCAGVIPMFFCSCLAGVSHGLRENGFM